jgi:cell division initiation protein
MITPIDIQNKEFTKGVRGYKEEEVDSFLDLITLDIEKLIMDNKRLKDSLAVITAEVERYRGSEAAVLETLDAARALMGDISASAEKRAEILLKNAEMDAERIQRDAKESVARLTDEARNLRNRVNLIRSRFRTLLEAELERFDTLSEVLFPDGEDILEALSGDSRRAAARPALPLAEDTAKTSSRTITNLRSSEGI